MSAGDDVSGQMQVAEPEELSLQVNGLHVAGRVWGPPGGEPCLALHGWLDNAGTFDRLAPLLPGLRLVALDLPGHGLSDWRHADADYLFMSAVPFVFEAADALGWERFSLMGHSMGGAIAALAGGSVPERITRLVSLEAVGPPSSLDAKAPLSLARALAARRRRRAEPTLHASPEAAAQRLVRAVAGLPESAARVLIARALRPVPGGFIWRSDPRLRDPSALYYTEEQVRAFLRRITAPALFVIAEQGYAFPEPATAERIACVPGVRVARLLGGHHVHLEDAPGVAEAIRHFLALS
jgi:pimeloyl-ACP methyl ester carboxylesterase